MTKNFPLQPLVNLAHQKNENAARKFGQLNQQLQQAQTKLDTLLQYHKDYLQRFQEAVQGGMSPAGLRNFQDFINRLEEAITQQRSVVERISKSVQSGRDELQDTQRRMKSFDTLAQRHAASENLKEAKAEQRQHDELTGRFAAYMHKPEDQ